MILLDTDRLNMLVYRQGASSQRLIVRMSESFDQAFATTIVSVEEQMRGWLAEIHRRRELAKQRVPYERLAELVVKRLAACLRRLGYFATIKEVDGAKCLSGQRERRPARRAPKRTFPPQSEPLFRVVFGL